MGNRSELFNLYNMYGFTPFPLSPGGKQPLKGIKFETVETMEFKEKYNIGLFPGSPNGLVVVDLDNEKSQTIVVDKFREMGIYQTALTVRTPQKNGLHVWLRCLDVPEDTQCCYNLDDEIGDGELRLRRNIYIVAPGSVIAEGPYRIEQGSIEAFASQPLLSWQDITWLIRERLERDANKKMGGNKYHSRDKLLCLPLRLIYREMPKSLELLKQLSKSEKNNEVTWIKDKKTGEVTVYHSVSEAEAAVICGLILCGWTFDEIEDVFDKVKPVHYKNHSNRKAYLTRVYNNCIIDLFESEPRKRIMRLYEFVKLQQWPGQTGGTDQRVLLAIVSKAWQLNTLQPTASFREISEHAGVVLKTVSFALERLQKHKLIRSVSRDFGNTASCFDISPIMNVNEEYISTPPKPVTSVYQTDTTNSLGELWGKSFLGGVAFMMYSHLSDEPIGLSALRERTGKSRNALIAAGIKLEKYGLAEPDSQYTWKLGSVSPQEAAEEIGAIKRAEMRRNQHQDERQKRKDRQRNYMRSVGNKGMVRRNDWGNIALTQIRTSS